MTTTTSAVNGRLWGAAAADWATFQELTCEPVYRAVLRRLAPAAGSRYLDAGCGAGLALQMAAAEGLQVTGLDAAEELLAIAKTRVPAADLRTGELEHLPFAEDAFDLVTGFNSFQYAADPVRALAEARRVAKPGAPVVVMTWGPPAGMAAAAVVAALRPLLPTPPPGTPGPFALSDETALRAFASSAGLEPVEVFDVKSPWHYADLASALRGLGSSGVARWAAEHSSRETVDAAHTAALAAFVQPDGSYLLGASFRCLVARGAAA